MSWGDIAGIGFITLETESMAATLELSCGVLGLRETCRLGSSTYLAAADRHHEIIYRETGRNALGHISLEARHEEAVERVRHRVVAAGFGLHSETPLEDGVATAFSFVGPDRMVYEIFSGLAPARQRQPNFGPDRYGHINLHPSDLAATRTFLCDLLGFRISDQIGSEAYFLRCNSDHHGIALIQGRGSLHHHAWQVQSIADLGRIADRLDQSGRRLLWGPVRHGAGHNIAIYFEDSTGCVIEIYADMEQIYDDDRQPVVWDADDNRWFNRWSDHRPEDFRRFGVAAAPITA